MSEWGPFLLLDNGRQAGNRGEASFVTRDLGIEPSGPRDYPNLQRLTLAAIDGVKERGALAKRLLTEKSPDFSVIVFTETHRSGHSLWHTVSLGSFDQVDDSTSAKGAAYGSQGQAPSEAERAAPGIESSGIRALKGRPMDLPISRHRSRNR